jgi:hypothetical protein
MRSIFRVGVNFPASPTRHDEHMPKKQNPLKLNALQLRTLTILQALARLPEAGEAGPGEGEYTIRRFPGRHADHFHVGEFVVGGNDATGLFNEAVWNALTRKMLARGDWPNAITLTVDGLAYDTGLSSEILHSGGH